MPDKAGELAAIPVLLERNDEWQLQHRYITLETVTRRGNDHAAAVPQVAA